MKIHEFQAKRIFVENGVPVPRGIVAAMPKEAGDAYDELGSSFAVVKAQVHAGGRGKGTIKDNPEQHGVQLVNNRAQASQVADRLLGGQLVTVQTGPEGQTVRNVLIEEGCDIARELYLGIVLDRGAARHTTFPYRTTPVRQRAQPRHRPREPGMDPQWF